MTEYLAPGVYIEEVPYKSHPIEGVRTSTADKAGSFPIDHLIFIICHLDSTRCARRN